MLPRNTAELPDLVNIFPRTGRKTLISAIGGGKAGSRYVMHACILRWQNSLFFASPVQVLQQMLCRSLANAGTLRPGGSQKSFLCLSTSLVLPTASRRHNHSDGGVFQTKEYDKQTRGRKFKRSARGLISLLKQKQLRSWVNMRAMLFTENHLSSPFLSLGKAASILQVLMQNRGRFI